MGFEVYQVYQEFSMLSLWNIIEVGIFKLLSTVVGKDTPQRVLYLFAGVLGKINMLPNNIS